MGPLPLHNLSQAESSPGSFLKGVAACSGAQGIWSLYGTPASLPGVSSPCSCAHKGKAQSLHSFARSLPFPATTLAKCQHPALLHIPSWSPKPVSSAQLPGLSSRVPGEKRRNPFSHGCDFQPRMIFINSVPKARRGTGHTGAEQPGACWSQKKTRQSFACKVNLKQAATGGAARRACPTARDSIFQGYHRAGMLAGRGQQRAQSKCLGTIVWRALQAHEDGLWHTSWGCALTHTGSSAPGRSTGRAGGHQESPRGGLWKA